MQVTQKKLEAFPPKSNPFRHDSYHMGQRFGKNHMLMFPNHDSEPLKYFILIDTSTGKRIKFTVDGDEDKPADATDRLLQSVAEIKSGATDTEPTS